MNRENFHEPFQVQKDDKYPHLLFLRTSDRVSESRGLSCCSGSSRVIVCDRHVRDAGIR